MTNATVVSSWKDANSAYIAVSVVETGGKLIEYNASTPLLDSQGVAFTAPQLKTNLIAAVKGIRDNQQSGSQTIGTINGTVVI